VAMRVPLEWIARDDGMYLQFDPAAAGKIDAEDVRQELLKSKIVNADLRRIAGVLSTPSNTAQFVGPRFQVFDERKREYVILNIDRMTARLTVLGAIRTTALSLTLKDVEFMLSEKGVVFGQDWNTLAKVLRDEIYDEPVLIASAQPPVDGDPARIREVIRVDPDARPFELDNGKVDFRTLDNIQQVNEGDVISLRIPPTAGTDGKDLFGSPIKAAKGEDKLLPRGSYTVITPEGTELRAGCAGYLYREGANIAVGKLFVVSGDVNFKSGNIKYSGDVLVRGSVLSQFRVEAQGDITIDGCVEGAVVISETGSIHINQGIFGKGQAMVKAAKNIETAMAQDCRIEAEGTLTFSKYIRESQMQAKEIIATKPDAIINNCEILIYEKLHCARVGTPQGGVTKVRVIDLGEEKLMAKFEELSEATVKMKVELEEIQRQLKTMQAILKQTPTISDGSRKKLQAMLLQHESARSRLEITTKRRESLNDQMKDQSRKLGEIAIGQLLPMLEVDMHGVQQIFREPRNGIDILWNNGRIEEKPMKGKF